MKQLFQWAGVTKADAQDCLAIGLTIGLMLWGAALIAVPTVFLLYWFLPESMFAVAIGIVAGVLIGYVFGRETRRSVRRPSSDNHSSLEWG